MCSSQGVTGNIDLGVGMEALEDFKVLEDVIFGCVVGFYEFFVDFARIQIGTWCIGNQVEREILSVDLLGFDPRNAITMLSRALS